MRRLLPAVLFLVACGGETTVSTTSPVAEPTTTTTVESTTTTAEAEGPVDVCRRGTGWESGVVYEAGCFVAPVLFEVTEDGWGSEGAGEDWVKVRWLGGDGLRVRVALIAYRSTSPPERVLDRISAVGGIAEVSARRDVVVAGASGLMVDVEGAAEEGGEIAAPGSGGCTGDSPLWFGVTRFGHGFADSGSIREVIGVGACHLVRIYAVQVGETTVTLLGGTDDTDRHEEAVAKIESLFEGMSFGTGGGS